MRINETRAINFLQSLIEINTINPPGDEKYLAEFIKSYVERHGLTAFLKPVTKNRDNIIVTLSGKKKNPSLIFSGHLDTVPIGNENKWNTNPFSGEVIDGKLYGRGACDMKGGVASLIQSMIIMKENGFVPEVDIIFVGTVGEEVDCVGAIEVMEEELIHNSGAIVIAEPSSNNVFSAHKGVLWVELKVFGKTAHGSMPNEGINAITHMTDLIKSLNDLPFLSEIKHPLLDYSTLNVAIINGGIKENVVPDICSMTIDIRTVPGIKNDIVVNQIQQELLRMEEENKGVQTELKVIHDLIPLSNDKEDPFIEMALNLNSNKENKKQKEKGANYYTDASIFRKHLDVPIIIFGPGNEKMAHQPNEYLEIDKYFDAIKYYINISENYSQNFIKGGERYNTF